MSFFSCRSAYDVNRLYSGFTSRGPPLAPKIPDSPPSYRAARPADSPGRCDAASGSLPDETVGELRCGIGSIPYDLSTQASLCSWVDEGPEEWRDPLRHRRIRARGRPGPGSRRDAARVTDARGCVGSDVSPRRRFARSPTGAARPAARTSCVKAVACDESRPAVLPSRAQRCRRMPCTTPPRRSPRSPPR